MLVRRGSGGRRAFSFEEKLAIVGALQFALEPTAGLVAVEASAVDEAVVNSGAGVAY